MEELDTGGERKGGDTRDCSRSGEVYQLANALLMNPVVLDLSFAS